MRLLSMILQALGKVLVVIFSIGCFLLLGFFIHAIASEWFWSRHREHVAADIIASYKILAEKGKVAMPRSGEDAVTPFSRCYRSLPLMLTAKTPTGDQYCYWAVQNTNSDRNHCPWSFKLLGRYDAKGNVLTNTSSP